MDGKPGLPGRVPDRFLAHWHLIAFASLTAMAEAATLTVTAPAARALAPQVTALPPLAVFHDLRWLYSAQRSWLGFGVLLAALVVARSVVNAVLMRLAWPAGTPAPPPLAALRSALGVTAVACVLMSPIVSLSMGVAILPFSWPFLAMLPALLVIGLPLSHAGVARSWWRVLPPLAAVGWLLAEFAVLSVTAAVAGAVPVPLAVPLAGLAGLVNARAWYGVTVALQRPRSRAHGWLGWLVPQACGPAPGSGPGGGRQYRVPAAPLALAVAVAVLIAGTRLVFMLAAPGPGGMPARGGQAVARLEAGPGQPRPGLPGSTARPHGRRHPVLEIMGFGSSCCGGSSALARTMPQTLVQQFSYRGLSASGRALPYGRAASDLHLAVLGDRIAAQMWRLYGRTRRPVDIVAESEGTLGVYAMLARHPHVPVGSVVLLSPIVAPGQGRFRGTAGSSAVTGGELNAVVRFIGGLSPFGASGAQRLLDSVNRVGARFATQAAEFPLRVMEIVPLADAVTLPACQLPRNVFVVQAFHGRLLGDPVALRMVRRFLARQKVRAVPGLRAAAEIMASAAAAWRLPEPQPPSPPCAS